MFRYGVNDLFDRDTDAINTKKHDQEHRIAAAEIHGLVGALVVSLLIGAVMLTLIPTQHTWLLLLIVFLSAAYSTPPLRFKPRAVLDSHAHVLFFSPRILGYAISPHQL